MADLTTYSQNALKALGTPEAFDELIRRINVLQAQVIKQRREQLRRNLPIALAYAMRESRLYHRSLLTGRCGVVADW